MKLIKNLLKLNKCDALKLLKIALDLKKYDLGLFLYENCNVNDNFKNKEYYSSSNNIIISYIENNFNSKLSEIEINTIKKWKHIFDNDVIKYAVDKACLSNVKSLAYVIGILKNWNDKGYKDIEDCQNEYIDISDLKDGVIINDDDWMNE